MTPPFASFDPDLAGRWINAEQDYGYKLSNKRPLCGWLWRAKMVWDFEPIYDHPLAFVQADGTMIAPCAFDATDQMSSPVLSQGWLPKDGQVGPYMHDCAFHLGGVFFRYPKEKVWTFRQLTRRQADALLKASILADPIWKVGKFRAWAVWAGVRMRVLLEKFGAACLWHTWRVGDDIPQWPGQERPGVDHYGPDSGGYGGGE